MYALISLGIIIFFSLILAKSASLVIKSVIKIGRKFRIPEFAIGFFVLGFATSLPEMFVAVNALMSNNPQLSLGNLLGATFVLLTLVMAIPATVSGSVRIKILSSKEIVLSSFVALLPIFLSFDGVLSRFDGIALFLLYLTYVYVLNRDASFVEKVKTAMDSGGDKMLKNLLILLAGVLGVFASSKFIVDFSLDMANTLLVPPLVIGVLLLSIGTNLPELSLAIKASAANHESVGVGDFLGSAAVNTFVISILALVKPFSVQVQNLASVRILCVFSVLGVILFGVFMRTKNKLSRREGLVLLVLYVAFIASEVFDMF